MKLYVQEYGEGHPLIILHGLFGASDNWVPFCRQYARHFHVFALDQRNHGRSPHDAEMTIERMACDVLEWMDSRAISSAHLLGHSMGGKTAMQLALEHPDRLDKLVVVDIAPRAYPGSQKPVCDALLGLDLSQFENRQQIDEALETKIPERNVRQFLLKNIGRNPLQGKLCWKINLPVICANLEGLTGALSPHGLFMGAALFIRGECSDYIRDEDWTEILELFPQAQQLTIPGAGHWTHVDAPEVFLDATTRFLLG
jgi:esterase